MSSKNLDKMSVCLIVRFSHTDSHLIGVHKVRVLFEFCESKGSGLVRVLWLPGFGSVRVLFVFSASEF